MATIKSLTQELKKVVRIAADYDRQVTRLEKQAKSEITNRFVGRYAELQHRKEAAEESLRSLNPYMVGNQFQRVAEDGLLGETIYQVTHVINHFKFLARPITAKGQLGKSYETFRTKKDGYRVPDQIRKVKKRQPVK